MVLFLPGLRRRFWKRERGFGFPGQGGGLQHPAAQKMLPLKVPKPAVSMGQEPGPVFITIE